MKNISNQKWFSLSIKLGAIDNLDFIYGQFKSPIIKDCVSNLECKVEELIPGGDHIIFICRVMNILNNNNRRPLIYYNSSYI